MFDRSSNNNGVIESLRAELDALRAEFNSARQYVTDLERQGRAELARITASVSRSAAPVASVAPETQGTRSGYSAPTQNRPVPGLSNTDAAWLARVLTTGATVNHGAVTLTLSRADAQTIARRLDAAEGGSRFSDLARGIY